MRAIVPLVVFTLVAAILFGIVLPLATGGSVGHPPPTRVDRLEQRIDENARAIERNRREIERLARAIGERP